MLTNLALAYPELLLAVSALVLLVFGAFNPKATGLVGLLAVLALIGAAAISAFGPHGVAFSGSLKADAAAGYAGVAVYLAGAAAIPLGGNWFARKGAASFEFPV